MLRRLQERQPGSPLYRILWWYLYHALTFYWFVPCYRYRSWGGRNIPDTGPVLLLSNHQSFLDPIIVGLGGHKRQFHPLARKTLWDSALYRALTVPMNPIPVDQDCTIAGTSITCPHPRATGHESRDQSGPGIERLAPPPRGLPVLRKTRGRPGRPRSRR